MPMSNNEVLNSLGKIARDSSDTFFLKPLTFVFVVVFYIVSLWTLFSGFAAYIARTDIQRALESSSSTGLTIDVIVQQGELLALCRSVEKRQLEDRLDSKMVKGEVVSECSNNEFLEANRDNKQLTMATMAAISSFNSVLLWLSAKLVILPTIAVTLIVTISAGALGSAVAFTRKFSQTKHRPTVGTLFVNMGEGMAASVAIFLFAGAGLLLLSQGSGPASKSVELSPYMVAFLAFLSGFMAEDAFRSIQNRGHQIFRDNEPDNSGTEQTDMTVSAQLDSQNHNP